MTSRLAAIAGARQNLERIPATIAGLRGARRALLAACIGAGSVLAFAPIEAWPVLFVSFGALVWLLDGSCAQHAALRPRLISAALTGFWFGFGFFAAGLYWVAEAFLVEPERYAWLIPFALGGLAGGMALFYAAAAALAMLLWMPGAGRIFALALSFGFAEFARGHVLTGFPWNLLGYALTANLPMMQLASVVGVYALSLFAVLLFASPAAVISPRDGAWACSRGAAAMAAFLFGGLILGIFWGNQRLSEAANENTNVRLRIVQAAIDQANKWRPENSAEIFNDYLALSKGAGDRGLTGISLVVWPETAVPFLLTESSQALLGIADLLPEGTKLLVGSVRLEEPRDANGRATLPRIYNSLLVMDDKAQVLGSYDKMHLVPFGEYLPFEDLLETGGIMDLLGLRDGFSSGRGPRRIAIPDTPEASPLICYEAIFPDDVTEPGTRPGWLLNITNDAWFGTSAGPHQHFHQARLRAVEQGLPLVRAANTGISAIVDPYGRVTAELGLGMRGALDGVLPRALPPTLYVKFGRTIETSLLALIFIGWLACRVHQLR